MFARLVATWLRATAPFRPEPDRSAATELASELAELPARIQPATDR